MKKNVTQKDIAKALRISIITVQRALNNTGYISAELKEKIEAYTRKVNYIPHKAAQALSMRSPRKIAIFSTAYPAFFWDDIATGIEIARNQITDFGFEVTYQRISRGNTKEYIKQMREALKTGTQAVGLVNNQEFDMKKIFDLLDEKTIPYLTLNIDAEETNRLCFIGPDYHAEGRLVAELFCKFLPRNALVAIIHSSSPQNENLHGANIFGSRLSGFEDFIRGAETPIMYRVVPIDYEASTGSIVKELRQFIAREGKNTQAIYCIPPVHDLLCKLIEENELTGRIKIVGPDLSPEIRKYLENGTLTAEIYQNPILQGYTAVKILEHYLETGRLPGDKILHVVHDIVLKENIRIFNNHTLFTDLAR